MGNAKDGTEDLDFNRLIEFLEKRISFLEVFERSHSRPYKPEREQLFLTEKVRSHKNGFSLPQCKVQTCQEPHPIEQCAKYRSMITSESKVLVTSNRRCFNCLSASHSIQQCPSTSLCKICQRKHHTTFQGSSSKLSPHLVATLDALQINRTGTITVLPTANVKVRSQNVQTRHLRALVDNCA